jgi:hypothetical protein
MEEYELGPSQEDCTMDQWVSNWNLNLKKQRIHFVLEHWWLHCKKHLHKEQL